MHDGTSGRRFTILDALVLVAATAFGLALMRETKGLPPGRVSATQGAIDLAVVYAIYYSSSMLIVWSLAAVAQAERRPRPPLGDLLRSPGFIAVASALLGVAVVALPSAGLSVLRPSTPGGTFPLALSRRLSTDVGHFVIGAALPMAFYGRWLPRRTWVDRLGWAVGLLWVALLLLYWARSYVSLLF
ncbi:hypothetical protein [Tautonia plasticadhaerens]|uniref:Uncharacterized protein n=1 Tax=Tautonia plasticadhaerens TaxID=2527974 RepID=A0A518GWU6_9BACT|nr:hypothetical protein [Tautonia plasticadhaerens]QDV33067.1 hypothetical protein ElP_09090 [Tautonia plasticadhaerens]